jgi:hypothetical protein
MKRNLCILLLAFLILSCQSSIKKTETGGTIAVDIDNVKRLRFSDIFDEVDYTPLETNDSFLIGTVERLRIFEDHICLLSDKSLHIFDAKTGKGDLKLSKLGSGPGEYQSLYDVFIDKSAGRIELLDMNAKRIQNYDLKGTFLNSTVLPFMSFSFVKDTDATYWFYNNQMSSDITQSKVIYYDVNKEDIVKAYFPIDKHLSGYFFVVEGNNFVKDKNGVFYFSCPSNSIYHLDGKSDPETIFTIDFGQHTVPQEFYDHHFADIMEFAQEANKHEYVYFINNFSCNSDYVFLSFFVDRKCFWSLHEITTGRTYTASILEDDFNFLNYLSLDYGNIPCALTDEYLYFLISSEQFLSLKWKTGDEESRSMANKYYLDEQSNPILVKCKLSKKK